PGPGLGPRVADQGPGRDHPGGNQTGAVGDLGGLPGRQLAGSHLRIRLPGEHGRFADVRIAAAPGAGRRAEARPGHRVVPVPDHDGVHAAAGGQVLGRSTCDTRRRGVQPGPEHRPQARRVLRPRVQPGELDRGDRIQPGDDHPQAARLLAGRRARLDARHHHREELRPAAGQELRHPGRQDHVHRRVHVQVVLEQRYHLNESFLAQYWYWLDNVLHGNLGISITLRENVSTLLASRVWTTAG